MVDSLLRYICSNHQVLYKFKFFLSSNQEPLIAAVINISHVDGWWITAIVLIVAIAIVLLALIYYCCRKKKSAAEIPGVIRYSAEDWIQVHSQMAQLLLTTL